MDDEQARFFDSRAAYQMFTTATNEKATVAARLSRELVRYLAGTQRAADL